MVHPDVLAALQQASQPPRGTDIGSAGQGSASGPRYVRIAAGQEFAIKCPAFRSQQQRYLCANEWITSLLAMQCDFPTLPVQAIQHPVCLAVGWPYIPPANRVDLSTHPRILDAVTNPEALYHMAAFDAFVRNPDRHARNVVVVRSHPNTNDYSLILYDHDRALMCMWTPADLTQQQALDDPAHWMREPELRRRIVDRARLSQAVARIKDACNDEAIETIVEGTPETWLPAGERRLVIEFLHDRRERLQEIVETKARAVLPPVP